MKPIIVVIHNGVAEVLEKPKGVDLVIRDYDVEGVPEHELSGDGFLEATYDKDDEVNGGTIE